MRRRARHPILALGLVAMVATANASDTPSLRLGKAKRLGDRVVVPLFLSGDPATSVSALEFTVRSLEPAATRIATLKAGPSAAAAGARLTSRVAADGDVARATLTPAMAFPIPPLPRGCVATLRLTGSETSPARIASILRLEDVLLVDAHARVLSEAPLKQKGVSQP